MTWWDNVQAKLFANPIMLGLVSKALATQKGTGKNRPALLQAHPDIDDSRALHLPRNRMSEPTGRGPRKYFGVGFPELRMFARNNPWIRAAIDIRKNEVAGAGWDIVPALEHHKKELKRLQQLVSSICRFPDRSKLVSDFEDQYLSKEMVKDLIQATVKDEGEELDPSDVNARFMYALQDITRTAEQHAYAVRQLFEFPNRNRRPWPHILRAVIPDLLTLDQGCIELRRNLYPVVRGWPGLPQLSNPITEMHWVDGATVRPVIDRHGQLAGIDDSTETITAYEQWLEGQKTESRGWRVGDLLYLQENPQTDVTFMGYGLSRVEALIMTSTLEAWADKDDLEEFKRGTYGGFLNVKDESFVQEDVDALRYYIEEALEGSKKLPITAFNELEYISANPNFSGGDKKSTEKLKRYVLRVCAMFEMPPVKIGIFETATYNNAEAGEEVSDDGLRSILDFLDDNLTREVVAHFGHDDIAYKSHPSHMRDDPAQLEVSEKRQKLGIDTPNDTRIEYGKEPVEWGEKPSPYFEKFFEAKGQTDGGGGDEEEGSYDEEDQEDQFLDGDGESGDDDEDNAVPDKNDKEGDKPSQEFPDNEQPGKPKGEDQGGSKADRGPDKQENKAPSEGDEVKKALMSGFSKALDTYADRNNGKLPSSLEFEIEDDDE